MQRLEETHVSNRETDQPAYPFCQTNAMVISYSDSIIAPAVPHFIHFLASPEGRFFRGKAHSVLIVAPSILVNHFI